MLILSQDKTARDLVACVKQAPVFLVWKGKYRWRARAGLEKKLASLRMFLSRSIKNLPNKY